MRLALRALVLVLLAHAASGSAAENRIEFLTMLGEKRVEQSEVCFFPGDSTKGFVGKFLSTNDVRCLSADAVVSLPPGSFNVFARHGSTLVGSHPGFVDNANPAHPGYRAVELSLHPAATLDVSAVRTRDREWLAIYLTNESRNESLASVHPVADAQTKVLVPADMPLVPMVVRRGAIVRVGRPMTLRAGETRSLPPLDQWGSGRDVVVLLKTDALLARDAPAQPPVVELHAGTAEPLRPMFPLRGAGRFDESLAIFKDVPAGTHQVLLSGDGWQGDELTVATTSVAEAVTPPRPLHARIAGIVEIRASIGALATIATDVRCPAAELAKATADEADDEAHEEMAEATSVAAPTVRLLRCSGEGERRNRATARELPLHSRQSEVVERWSDLEPGVYAAEVAYRWLSQRSNEVAVRPGNAETLTVALQPETVTGRVTHGNTPVQALVSFSHSLAPALSDEAGNYTALVNKGPQRSNVRVRICAGGGYQYRPQAPIDKVLDIDIPKNELVVRVVDEQGRPVEKAGVVGGPLFPEGDAVYAFMPFAPTDSAGETRFRDVVADADLEICAGLSKEYESQCAPHFRMGNRPLHRIEIRLRRQETLAGRLLSQTPFVGARVWQVSAGGAMVGMDAVSPAGEFLVKRTGAPGEYLVVSSLSHPLAVFEMPLTGPLEFPMPTQSQALAVVLTKNSPPRWVALELAGRMIPSSALVEHLTARRVTHQMESGQTLEIRDLAPDPLVVYSVPPVSDRPPEWRNLDPLEHPHLRIALPRFRVTGPVVQIE